MRYLRTEAERVSRKGPVTFSFNSALSGSAVVIAGLTLAAFVVLHAMPSSTRVHLRGSGVFLLVCGAFAIAQGAVGLVIYHHQAHLAFVKAGAVNVARGAALVIVAAGVGVGLWRSQLDTTIAIAVATFAVAVASCWDPLLSSPLAGLRKSKLGLGAESMWLTIFYVASAGFATVDIFIVAVLLRHSDVAAFGAAQRYYAFALGAGPALTAVLRIRTAQADMIDSQSSQAVMLKSWLMKAGIPALMLVGALAVAAPFAIPIANGGRYPTAVPVFELLLIGVAAYYVMMPGPSLLMTQNRYRALALAVAGSFACNALGDYVIVRVFRLGIVGIAGVAGVTYLAFFIATVLLVVKEWRQTAASPLSLSPHRPSPEAGGERQSDGDRGA